MGKFIVATATVLALATLAAPAIAQDGEPQAADLFGGTARMKVKELAGITGRADTSMEVRAQNSATVSNNRVDGQSQTGTISFDSAAFSNLNGLSLLSANTGNNVAINSSLNVNVAIQR